MAFDFENEIQETDSTPERHDEINWLAGRNWRTDAYPTGDNYTGREYMESVGYFDAADEYYVRDPKPYLNLFPATSKNFGLIILEPGQDENPCQLFGSVDAGLPQLVFKQVYGVIEGGVKEVATVGKLLHIFKGIYMVTKEGDNNYYKFNKIGDVFIFDPNKDYPKV